MDAYLSATLLGVLAFFVLLTGYLVLASMLGGKGRAPGNGAPTQEAERARRQAYGPAERFAYRLAQANVPFRVGQYVLYVVLASVTLGIAFVLVPPHHPAQLALGVLAGVLGAYWLTGWALQRKVERFTAALPDALDLLSSSLRTGQPIRAGLELVAREMPDPLGAEMAKVVREIELGLGEVDALENLAERLDSIDVQMLVTSIAVQKEVGGNLAEILGTLAQTIRTRFRIRGQVDAYTAQARLSAKVLVALPVVFALVLHLIRPSYLSVLISDPIGHAVLIAAVVAWLLGWLVIRQILAVEV